MSKERRKGGGGGIQWILSMLTYKAENNIFGFICEFICQPLRKKLSCQLASGSKIFLLISLLAI